MYRCSLFVIIGTCKINFLQEFICNSPSNNTNYCIGFKITEEFKSKICYAYQHVKSLYLFHGVINIQIVYYSPIQEMLVMINQLYIRMFIFHILVVSIRIYK